MVLPISGFLPVPLPMMIPFMGAQSLVIGKMFGEGFQYGKRKISAMPNEEFNQLTFQKMMSNARDEMQASIPTMIQAMQDMKPMVLAVVHEFTNYLSLVISAAPQQAEQIVQQVRETSGFNAVNDQLVQIIADLKGGVSQTDIIAEIRNLFPSLPGAGGVDMPVAGVPLTTSQIIAGDVSRGATAIPPGMTIYNGKLVSVQQLQNLLNAQTSAQIRLDARQGTPIIAPRQTTNLTTKRLAGQSQRLEKTRLIKFIRDTQKTLTVGSPKNAQQLQVSLNHEKQQLINLLARYRF